ncbi:hypothetical protein Zmor_006556 [Zophobas morio]|uniref:Transmembrane protein 223 n=1 Tax=Zophobas morio TaxID=2755281 RepID=A0AA38IU57_9CUCU|nr:hypothetical protein Zmor_006556 [Zophobas morio]
MQLLYLPSNPVTSDCPLPQSNFDLEKEREHILILLSPVPSSSLSSHLVAIFDQSKETAWWRKINLGENKYRNSLALISFAIGYGILTVTWMYTLKSVRYLILHQGGQNISLVTYTPFGGNRILTVNLKNVSCKESRTVAKSQLPIKVKGHYLHYILDMRGDFKNPKLFDYTAGLQRKWRKIG